MNKDKKNLWENKWLVYFFNFCISLVVCGTYVFCKHFSTDDYTAIFYEEGWRTVSSSFRVPIAFLYYIFDDLLGYSTTTHQMFFLLALIAIVALAITLMTKETLHYIESPSFITFLLINGSFILMFENGFFSEWLWFAGGALQWASCIICAVGAAIFLNHEDNRILNVLLGLGLLIFGTGSYQLCLVHFVYCYMILGFAKNKGVMNKHVFIDIVRTAMLTIISFVINILLTKLAICLNLTYATERVSHQRLHIRDFLSGLVSTLNTVWIEGYRFFYKGFWVSVLVLFIIICAYALIINKCHFNTVLYAFFVCISGTTVIWMSGYTQGTMAVTPRQCLYFIGIVTCIIIIPLCLPKKTSTKIGIAQSLILAAIIIYNSMIIQITAIDVMLTMKLDEQYFQQVYDKICEYESTTGKEISTVVVYYDSYPMNKYYNEMIMPVPGHIEVKSLYEFWSWRPAMNYYLNKQYVAGDIDNEIAEHFSQQNWNKINLDEQMIFEGTTLHLCAY